MSATTNPAAETTQADFEAWAATPRKSFTAADAAMRTWILALRQRPKPASDYPKRQAVAQWLASDPDGAKAAWLKG